jgi:hypothetical protein
MMYGLKNSIDLSFLAGREVQHVSIGVYQVWFGFDDDITISAHSEFVYFDGQSERTWRPKEPGAEHIAASTVALLGSTIQNYEGQPDGTLILNFSNGSRLTILDSYEQYESYTITRPGQTIVV